MVNENLDWQELDKFVRKYLKITTQLNSMKALISKRDGSKTRFYKWKKWRYHDNFITKNGNVTGQGTLYYDKKPVFSTVYYYSFAENAGLKLLKFLGEAVLESYDYFSKNPSKTRFGFKNGEFTLAAEPIDRVKRILNSPININTNEWTVKIMLNAMLCFFVSFPPPIR